MKTEKHEDRWPDEQRRTAVLAECLRREALAFRDMLYLMVQHRQSLAVDDRENTRVSAASQDRVLRQLAIAHKRTSAVLAHLARRHGLSESATVRDLLACIEPSSRTGLTRARDELRSVLEQVDRETTTSTALLTSLIEYVGFCTRLFDRRDRALT